jgi:hypothetical protein
MRSTVPETSFSQSQLSKVGLTVRYDGGALAISDGEGAPSARRPILARMRDAIVFRLALEPVASGPASGPLSDGLRTACGSASLNPDATLHAVV